MSIQKNSPTDLLPTATFGNYDFATGTGGLGIILYTGARTKNRNQGIGVGDTFNFEDPVSSPSSSVKDHIDGWWGQDDQHNDGTITNVNGVVTVGQILDYLHAFDPTFNIPAFYMDMNQTVMNKPLTFVGQVTLLHPVSKNIMHTWSFDDLNQPAGPPGSGLAADGTFDLGSPITTIGQIPSLVGTSGAEYGPISHNLGSGKADYIAFAPSMNLSLFNPNRLFVTEFHMGNLNDGFEVIFLTVLGSKPPLPPIPEPSTFVLLGAGLLGLGFMGWRKSKK